MNGLGRNVGQLRHPFLDVHGLGIEALALDEWIKRRTKVRHGVGARARGEAPARRVAEGVRVDEVLVVEACAVPPVDPEVLGEDAGAQHADTVVLVARGRELPHARVDEREAGATEGPGRVPPVGLWRRVGRPPAEVLVEVR